MHSLTGIHLHVCMHMHTQSTTAPPWFDCFRFRPEWFRLCDPAISAWGLFNPLGFSQNASALFNGEQRISTQLPQSSSLSPGVSLYLHMSKKQQLWRSLALFIPASSSCPWSLHLTFFSHYHCKLPKYPTVFISVQMSPVKTSTYLLFAQKEWVEGVATCPYPSCYWAAFRSALSRRICLK